MEKVAIVTDTNCGLRPEEAASMGIHLIPMPVILDGKTYFEYVSISPEEFFERLKNTAHLERNMGNSDIFIAVNTLELLKKSGRVTAAGAALGSILSLKPVLRIQGGKLDAYRKVRGMGAAMQAMIEGLQSDQEPFGYPNVMLRAAYAGDRQAGENWQKVLQEAFPECVVGLDPLPLSVCCHVGYGALGVGITGTWIP